jgi:hypothetical protein
VTRQPGSGPVTRQRCCLAARSSESRQHSPKWAKQAGCESERQDLDPSWPSTCCPILLRSDRPSDRPTHRRASLRASVSSDDRSDTGAIDFGRRTDAWKSAPLRYRRQASNQPRPEAEALGWPPRGGRSREVAPVGGVDVRKARRRPFTWQSPRGAAALGYNRHTVLALLPHMGRALPVVHRLLLPAPRGLPGRRSLCHF